VNPHALRCTVSLSILALLAGAHAAEADRTEPDDLPVPRPEIAAAAPAVTLPAVPSFELPPLVGGAHRPRELRVRGASLLGTELRVDGYITSMFNCAATLMLANPGRTHAEIAAAIRNDAKLCNPLWFYLGDVAGASRDLSIWVVDVPRRTAKTERESISNEELAASLPQPKIAIGDHVVVTGLWTTRSSQEQATRGLLVYRSVAPAPTAAAIPATTAAPTTAVLSTAAAAPAVTPAALTARPPRRPIVAVPRYNDSIDHLNACIRQINAGSAQAAVSECRTALSIWDGNHLAWYTLATAYIAGHAWGNAVSAAERAVRLRPDQAMYQLYYGLAQYESVAESTGDATHGAAIATARDALSQAVQLDPKLWRAHYYLGRIYRDLDDTRRAADAFSRTIVQNPHYHAAYVALTEIYRSWEYFDQALAVAQLGTASLPHDAELWYELGLVSGAKHLDDQAIAAFGHALTERPGDARAMFQRGQIFARKGDLPAARRDLEAVVASPDPQAAELTSIAVELLRRLQR
jgi:tetratricopeptide (TPR) repeat protein